MEHTPYIAPAWLPSGHLQTIYPAKCISKPEVAFRRERWTTPDNDFIDVDFIDGQAGLPCVVLFHGLEGSSNSHYARSLMAEVKARGWSGIVPHFRGCSGEINIAPRFYHSGDAAEIDWVLRRLATHPTVTQSGKFYASGVSLGGNALLRWLGESQHQAEFIHAACAISAPMDLTAGGIALGKGFNLVYAYSFLRTMRKKSLLKLKQFPDLFDRKAMLKARDLYTFDNIVTAPLHGYQNTEDYWYNASAKHILHDITVPTLVLNAQNDPFLPKRFLPQSAAPSVQLDYPEQGGHVGFATGKIPGQLQWLPHKILSFLEQH
jgi:predicted alpha/beta-fold hydrolase